MTDKSDITSAEKKAFRERFERRIARYEAKPLELSRTLVDRKVEARNTIDVNDLFLTWRNTEKRFVWFAEEIGQSADLVAATIHAIHFGEPFEQVQPFHCKGDGVAYIYKAHFEKTGEEGYLPFSPHLGCFSIQSQVASIERLFFFLYIGDIQLRDPLEDDSDLPSRRPISLYQFFQNVYAGVAVADPYDEKGDGYARFFNYHYQTYNPKRFISLANRSLNRRRQIDARTRFRILARDKSTCQICGRKAPDVKLEVDHRTPVALGGDNSDANLWTLCEECNRGKSDQLFFTD